ncbi:MAG: protein rep [Pseudomonadota bacterium]|nr:protein rep [Pseudomonadota bacterium]
MSETQDVDEVTAARIAVAESHALSASFDMDTWLTGFAPKRYCDSSDAYRAAKKEAQDLAAKLLAASPDTEGGRLQRAAGWQMAGCRDVILGAYKPQGESTLRPYFSCRHPGCPACELARARRMGAAFADGWRDHLKKEGGQWFFITLTAGCPVTAGETPAAVRALRGQLAALRRRVGWQRCVIGCLSSIQVSHSPASLSADPRWHVHAHLLLHVLPDAQEKDVRSVFCSWQGRWQLDLLTRQCVSRFVRVNGVLTLTPPPLSAKKQTDAHVRRVVAYMVRPSVDGVPADLRPSMVEVLARCARLARFSSWGSVAGILRREGRFAPPVPELDEGEDEEDEPQEEEKSDPVDYPFGVAFKWRAPMGKYLSVVRDHPPSPLQQALEALRSARDASSIDRYLVRLLGKELTEEVVYSLRTYDPKGSLCLRRLHAHFLLLSARADVDRYSHVLSSQPDPPSLGLPPGAAASLADAQARRLAPLYEKLASAQRRVAHAEKLLFRAVAACEAAEKLWKQEQENKVSQAIPALASALLGLRDMRQAQVGEAAEKERLRELALRWKDRVIPRQADEPIYYQMCRLVLLDVADQHLRGRPSSVHFPVPYCALHRMADAFHSLPPGVQSFFASRRAFGRGVKTWLNGRMKGAYAGFGAKYWKRWSAEARKDQLAAQRMVAGVGQQGLFG